MKMILLAIILGLAPAIMRAETTYEVDAGIVRACFDATPVPVRGLPACVGEASARCQAEPGVGTTLGIIGCHVAETAVWDRLLNEAYSDVVAAFAAHDAAAGTTPFSRVESLRSAQRAWIAFRDAECTMRYAQYQDGTIRGPVQAHCMMRLTAARTFDLIALLHP